MKRIILRKGGTKIENKKEKEGDPGKKNQERGGIREEKGSG